MNTIPIRAIPRTVSFSRFSFSSVYRWANSMTKNGLVQISTDTVEALEDMMDIWNSTILIGMPSVPTPASCSRSLPEIRTFRRRISTMAKGSRTSPPMANRRNVSWKGSRLAPPTLQATSIEPNKNAVMITKIYALFKLSFLHTKGGVIPPPFAVCTMLSAC